MECAARGQQQERKPEVTEGLGCGEATTKKGNWHISFPVLCCSHGSCAPSRGAFQAGLGGHQEKAPNISSMTSRYLQKASISV